MPPPTTLILTALTAEARAVRRAGLAAKVIGLGGVRLAATLVPAGTRLVVMAGVGGAIDPGVAVGDVVVDAAADDLPAGVRRGGVHTVDHVVATAAEKAAVRAATGAAVVDMEQAAVHAWATPRGLTVVGVRAVSDAATDAVDPAVARFITPTGRPRPLVIAAALVRRPSLVPRLWRLNADTRVALARLTATLPAIVRAIERQDRPG